MLHRVIYLLRALNWLCNPDVTQPTIPLTICATARPPLVPRHGSAERVLTKAEHLFSIFRYAWATI
jgi:hypothetical protein